MGLEQPDLNNYERIETPSPQGSPSLGAHENGWPVGAFTRSPLPPSMIYPGEGLKFFHASGRAGGTPQGRGLPQPPSATPALNATAASQSITVVQQGQGTKLLTNNVQNADQTELNLIAGTDISLSADKFGGVTINASGSGFAPNLAVGDLTVNWPQQDPASFILTDDFIGQLSGTGSATNGAIGQLGWEWFGTMGTNGFTGGAFPYLGQFWWENSSTQQQTQGIFLNSMAATDGPAMGPWALFDVTGWKLTWIFKLEGARNQAAFSTAKKAIYIGLVGSTFTSAIPSNFSRPDVFFGLRFDTSTTAPSINDSFWTLEAVANGTNSAVARHNAQGTTKVTSVAPAIGVFHRLDISCTALGTITMTLDGGATNTLTVPVPTLTGTYTGTNLTGSITSGFAKLIPTTSTSTNFAAAFPPGGKITVTGFTGANAVLNGAQTLTRIVSSVLNPQLIWDTTLPNVTGQSVAGTIAGFPGVMPCVSFGNDDTTLPTANVCAMWVDRFSFVYNPKLAADFSASADVTKPRYFNPQT